MDVLVQVRFEGRQRLVERLEADTGIGRRGIVIGDLAHAAQRAAGPVVLVHHHRNRIAHAAEGSWQHRFFRHHGLFHAQDEWEENHLLLHQVGSQLLGEAAEDLAQARQFGVILAVNRAHLVEQRAQASDFLSRISVVRAPNVREQLGKRFSLPVPVVRGSGRRLAHCRQRVHHLVGGHMGGLTCPFQRLAAAATVVDTQLFKHPGRCRVLQRQFAYRLFRRNTHRFSPRYPESTLDARGASMTFVTGDANSGEVAMARFIRPVPVPLRET